MEQPLTDLASRRGGGGLLLRGLLVLGAIIVAILFAAELLLRVIDFSGPSRFELGEAFQFDPELGWVPAPNAAAQQTSGNRTISVRHSSLGLREQELSDIARIDSFSGRLVHLWLRCRGRRTVQRSSAGSSATVWDGQCRRFRLRNRPTIFADESTLERNPP